ncbi:MAG: hypothetical protein GAK28_02859 [Luteibacter sp.]|uniref:IPT/TIG domain-containing protein n=1 Tax=Luteibacter sp. TaxID=1886636 RepID=UPI0013840E94|nr:IPT/TIG domain-containing protein [Luteibacter sp.]KAF1005951.1 MAG: hypothetical protein GAK28_02859 [Luteibacter sp.]
MHKDRGFSARVFSRGRQGWLKRSLLLATTACLFMAQGFAPQVHAQNYAYDGNGRMVAATVPDGTTTRYVYDDMGNLLNVVAVPAGTPSIYSLRPSHGPIGQTVVIQGQGFSAQATDNAASFNGVAAVVSAATTQLLTTQVPVGTTTGSVTVVVAGKTATSDHPFVVDGNGLPPVITSVTPVVVAAGASVAVAGEHLAPVPGQTRLLLDSTALAIGSLSDASITFSVPKNLGSGHVVVQTPFGVATASTDLVVVPPGIDATTVASVARLAPGGTQSISIPASKRGVVLFDGGLASATKWLSLQRLAATGSTSESYEIYDPRNRMVAQGSISPGAPSVHLPKLTVPGTYSVYLKPADSAATTITMGLDVAPVLLLNAAAPTPVVGSVPNMSRRYLFTGQTGLLVSLPTISTTPTGALVSLQLADEGGNYVASTSGTTSALLNLPALESGRLYQVTISPGSGAIQNTAVLVSTQPGGEIVVDGPTVGVNAGTGVAATFTFSAGAGDNLELGLSGISMGAGTFTSVVTSIYDAAGTYVGGSSGCSAADLPSCRISISGLAGGRYLMTMSASNPGAMTFQATLTRDVTGTLTVGESRVFTSARPGQSARLAIQGNAGDALTIGVDNIAITPTGRNLIFNLIDPAGNAIVKDKSIASADAINVSALPSTGTYTLLVGQANALPMSVRLLFAPVAGGPLLPDGPAVEAAPIVGQLPVFTIDTTAKQDLELAIASTWRSNCSSISINVIDDKGNSVYSRTMYEKAGNHHLWGFAPGHYVVTLSNCVSNVTATLTRDLVDTLSLGETKNFDLSRSGQVIRYSFQAVAGQTIAVGAQAFTTTPAGKSVTVSLFAPDGTVFKSSQDSSAGMFNLEKLAIGGTYTLVVSPDNGVPATGQAGYLPMAGGMIVADGPLSTPSVGTGQYIYYSFDAVAGDELQFGMGSPVFQGRKASISYYVYDPTGSQVDSNYIDPTSSPYASRLALTNMRAGRYTVKVMPSSGGSNYTIVAALSHYLQGNLSIGSPSTVDIARQGQIAKLTFDGSAGARLKLNVSSLTTSPSGESLRLTLFDPTGANIDSASSLTSGSTYTLPTLSKTGTYTITLAPTFGVPAKMSLLLQ